MYRKIYWKTWETLFFALFFIGVTTVVTYHILTMQPKFDWFSWIVIVFMSIFWIAILFGLLPRIILVLGRCPALIISGEGLGVCTRTMFIPWVLVTKIVVNDYVKVGSHKAESRKLVKTMLLEEAVEAKEKAGHYYEIVFHVDNYFSLWWQESRLKKLVHTVPGKGGRGEIKFRIEDLSIDLSELLAILQQTWLGQER